MTSNYYLFVFCLILCILRYCTITTMATLFDRVVREVSQSVIVEPHHELACQFRLLYDETRFESIGLDLAVVLLNETHASGYLSRQRHVAMPDLNLVLEDSILEETSHVDVEATPVRTPIF